MNIIYIRHGKDRRGNYKYDEKLTSRGKYETREITKKLIEEYGLPDIIYYSPFYRTRQTKKEMMKTINVYLEEKNTWKEIKLIIEPRLGRFFTKNQRNNPDIRESTVNKGAIINEKWGEFHKRVESQLVDILTETNDVIWNVTHSLVLLHISRLSNIERSSHVGYLDFCIIKK